MIQVGDQVDRYQVLALVAQGAVSDVYRARDVTTGEAVALKILAGESLGDPSGFERFQREARITSRLDHPSVQRGIDAGRFGRNPYLATEWVDGESMRDLIRGEAPLAEQRALDMMLSLALSVRYSHSRGIVHRDLKPENVLIDKDGRLVILDFGLAFDRGAGAHQDQRITYANLTSVAGTPDYMAPEQVEGKRGDERTDIYALGTILFELLVGRPPFGADDDASPNALVHAAARLRGPAPSVRKYRPEVSPEVAAIVARALARDPDDRYPDVSALIADMEDPTCVDMSALPVASASAMAKVLRSQVVLAIVLSIAVLGGLAVLALLAQAARGGLP